ncbi:MAG: 50S ribosomal protein L4 [Candidatus Woesearchaeota archaeon]
MKIPLINEETKKIAEIELPAQFNEPFRPDLIRRAVLTIKSNLRQPYGADPLAGKRASAKLSRRRRDYKGAYGYGISRVPRKIMSRRGTRMNWQGAFAPGTVKGRQAHPPKAEKIWTRKINAKERRKAIRSALNATLDRGLVAKNGHHVPENYPFAIDYKAETIGATKEFKSFCIKIGLKNELLRTENIKIRAGKGTMRGRKYKMKKGPLFVVSEKCSMISAAKNLPGVEVVTVDNLNAYRLSHDINPGRLTIFTDKAIERLKKENLYFERQKKEGVANPEKNRHKNQDITVNKETPKRNVSQKTKRKGE